MHQIKIIREDILSDNWYVLKNFTIEQTSKTGISKTYKREAYDRGNGATILLYNKDQRSVILTRQFRLPTYVNGNASGMLIEACAGLLDMDNPEDAIKRETEEETGYKLSSLEKVFEVYMSPGSVTEKLYFFIAEYRPDMKESAGGGIDDEEIEVLEILFDDAMAMIRSGEIQDGKTIMLLQYLALSAIL